MINNEEYKIMTFKEKLLEVQNHIQEIQKGSENSYQKYKYLDLPSILTKLRPKLYELGLIIYTSFEPLKDSNGGDKQLVEKDGKMFNIQAKGYLHIIDASGSDELKIPFVAGAQNGDPAKAVGSMNTYIRRYALEVFANITGDLKLDPDNLEPIKETKMATVNQVKEATELLGEKIIEFEENNGPLSKMSEKNILAIISKLKGKDNE